MSFIYGFVSALLLGVANAKGGGKQLSPAYNHFYEFPLPVPPIATPLA